MTGSLLARIEGIVHPKTVAIIGASATPGKLGWLFMNIFVEAGFEHLYPVNPREKEVQGFTAYASVKEIPSGIDLAVVVTPPGTVLEMVSQCAEKGVKGVVINTSGFGEKGVEGKAIEKELARIARDSGTRILGPNCLGIYCPESRLPFPLRPPMKAGTLGMVSQSGSFCDLLSVILYARGVFFSKAISVGNECDLTATDFLEYLGEDEKTNIVVSYLEGVRDGRRFYEVARQVSLKKPLLLWKCGATASGARAAQSHTGAVAGSEAIWGAVSKQAGIVSVDSFEQTIDFVAAFHRLRLPEGRRVVIVSGPGGPAVGAADACVQAGLELARLSQETGRRLAGVMPQVGASLSNPVDLSLAALARPRLYLEAMDILEEDASVDMQLVIGVPGHEFVELFGETARVRKKPSILALPHPPDLIPEHYRRLEQAGVVVYPDARRGTRALAALADYAGFRRSHVDRRA